MARSRRPQFLICRPTATKSRTICCVSFLFAAMKSCRKNRRLRLRSKPCAASGQGIARALLTSEANITRRIKRAKDKLREAGLNPSELTSNQIQERLPRVFTVVYLLFNEGYSSSQAEHLIRDELCEEATRLALLLAEHPLTSVDLRRLFALASRLARTRMDEDAACCYWRTGRTRWIPS